MANEANNPLKALGFNSAEQKSSLGLVVARAGLGKTAILVQFALDCMMQGNDVLHVAIDEGVDKTRTWYDDMLRNITDGEEMDDIPAIMKKRMIMTFKESAFSSALLQERLDDLIKQDIFAPQCMIIDGYDFAETSPAVLDELITAMKERGLQMIWFSAISHRNNAEKSAAGVPAPCIEVEDKFDTILLISPGEGEIGLEVLKCEPTMNKGTSLKLDPATMLIKRD